MIINLNDEQFGLYYALSTLAEMSEKIAEIADHNYLDSTTLDLCKSLSIDIDSVFSTAEEYAPVVLGRYVENMSEAIAERDHP